MLPREICEEYVRIVNAGEYHRLADLFSADAEFLGPYGEHFRGSAEIGRFYQGFLGRITPAIRAASIMVDGRECAMELEAKMPGTEGYALVVIDRFQVDDSGRICRFVVYTRPEARSPPGAGAAA